jgi:hypothetical protein
MYKLFLKTVKDPDPESDPKLFEKSDLDPDSKKIIPDPQHCFLGTIFTAYSVGVE